MRLSVGIPRSAPFGKIYGVMRAAFTLTARSQPNFFYFKSGPSQSFGKGSLWAGGPYG